MNQDQDHQRHHMRDSATTDDDDATSGDNHQLCQSHHDIIPFIVWQILSHCCANHVLAGKVYFPIWPSTWLYLVVSSPEVECRIDGAIGEEDPQRRPTEVVVKQGQAIHLTVLPSVQLDH